MSRTHKSKGSRSKKASFLVALLVPVTGTGPEIGSIERRHLRDWLVAYNFAKQLKALRFKTPYEAIEELWKSKPDIFNMEPHHHMLGLNT